MADKFEMAFPKVSYDVSKYYKARTIWNHYYPDPLGKKQLTLPGRIDYFNLLLAQGPLTLWKTVKKHQRERIKPNTELNRRFKTSIKGRDETNRGLNQTKGEVEIRLNSTRCGMKGASNPIRNKGDGV